MKKTVISRSSGTVVQVKTIHIRNMCCSRCITSVKQTLNHLGIKHRKIELGFAEILEMENKKESELELALIKSGFELIKTKEENISERIKIVIHKIFFDPGIEDLNNFYMQKHLEEQINIPYKKLSIIFSKYNNKTIESYFIAHKIEKAKAMIDETELPFSEIAFKLGYNAPAYLSRQFKEAEGASMHDYKLNHYKNRKFIDRL